MPPDLHELIDRHRDVCLNRIDTLAGRPLTAKQIRDARCELGDELATLVLESARLQLKARQKFGSGTWWVTDRSLQQSTPWQVARLKASWFAKKEVHDFCCGIGGDAVALSRRGPVIAVDSDPLIVALARQNVAASTLASDTACRAEQSPPAAHQVLCEDVTGIALPSGTAFHLDPDRRPGDRRVSRPDHCQPPWPVVEEMITRSDAAVVKLAPLAEIELPATHRCWISLGGSVREQSLLFGEVIDQSGLDVNGRSAIKLSSDGRSRLYLPTPRAASHQAKSISDLAEPETFLVDPDSAIRAAGLTESFARDHDLKTLGGPAVFLTGDHLPSEDVTQLATVGQVIWHGGADDRRLRKELRARNAFPITVKVRGRDHAPETLVKRYRKCGEVPVTLWIGKSATGSFAAITQPIDLP